MLKIQTKNNFFKYFCILTLIIIISFLISKTFLPAEDAAILFRYSKNLALSGDITYNLGGERVEGATDFLWMIVLSLFNKFNIDVFFSSIFIYLLSLFIIIRVIQLNYILSFFETLVVIIFKLSLSQFLSSIFGFSILFLELFLILNFIFFFKKKFFLLIFFSFIGCLIRPDFILFIIPMHIYNLFFFKKKKYFLYYFLFILIGLFYFNWRYSYFGLLFPLPFYIKNQWLFFSNLQWGREILIFIPILFIFNQIKFKDILNYKYIVIFFTFLIPTLYYANQYLIQNTGNRFYFYISTCTLIFLLELRKDFFYKIKKTFILLLFIFSVSSVLFNVSHRYNSFNFITKNDNFYKIFDQLKHIEKENKMIIAVTEAGLIPYITDSYTYDLFGLNTKKFVKSPASSNFIKNNSFDLIVLNSGHLGSNCSEFESTFSLKRKEYSDRNTTWFNFNLNLISGIDLNKYEVYLFNYPKLIFLNKNSINFKKIKSVFVEYGIQCKSKPA